MMRRMTKRDIEPRAGFEPDFGLLLAVLNDATRKWREELGDVSEEALRWQPHAGSHSIGAILLHIADVEAFWIEEICLGRERSAEELKQLLSEETEQYAGNWPTPPRMPLAEYYALQDKIRARTLESAREITPREYVLGKQGVDYILTSRWILHHVANHEAYHGGQAVLLKTLCEHR